VVQGASGLHFGVVDAEVSLKPPAGLSLFSQSKLKILSAIMAALLGSLDLQLTARAYFLEFRAVLQMALDLVSYDFLYL